MKFGGQKERERESDPIGAGEEKLALVYSEGFHLQLGAVCFAPISRRRRHQVEVITSNLGVRVKEKKNRKPFSAPVLRAGNKSL